jgi:PAS domain S-box-containing protein
VGSGGPWVDLDLLRGVVQGTSTAIMALRALRGPDGTIADFEWILCNPAGVRLLDLGVGDLVGHRVLAEMPDLVELGIFARLVAVTESGRPDRFEHPYVDEGVPRCAAIDLAHIHDGVVITFYDVTAHRQLEQTIQQNRELLRTVLDQVPAWLSLTTPDGTYVVVNRYYAEFFDRPCDEIEGRWYGDIFPQLIPVHEPLLARCRAGETVTVDDVIRSADGRPTRVHGVYRPVTGPLGDLRYISVMAMDVTALAESEERRRALVEAIPDLMFLVDAQGTFLDYHEPELVRAYVPPSAFLGRRIDQVLPPDVARKAMDAVREALATRRPVAIEYELPEHDEVHSFEARVVACGDDAAVVIVRDVTLRRRMEVQVRLAQKMQALGTFASGIAHDFNNLLTGIASHAGLLKADCLRAGVPVDDVVGIEHLQERGSALTKKLLALGRRQIIRRVPLDLNALLTGFVPIVRRLVGEHVAVVLRTDPELPAVEADPSQVEQILLNLVANARDAMPQGGRLELETHVGPAGAGDATPQAVLVVRDNGLGIPTDVLPHVFEPFFTTKEVGHGTGLGLAAAYGIVQEHGGSIDVSSTPGLVTEFRITLPGTERPPEPVAIDRAVVSSGQALANRGITILVAEDDPDLGYLFRRVLMKAGYTVLLSVDGEAAVELFRLRSSEVALVILDMVMPRKEGLDALREMRALSPQLPALLVSGYSETLRQGSAVDQRDVTFLPKPFSNEALLEAVTRLLER